MSLRRLGWVLVGWALLTAFSSLLIERVFSLDGWSTHTPLVVASVWSGGELVGRAVLRRAGDSDPELDRAVSAHPGSTLVYETVVGQGPILLGPDPAFALSVVAGHDGVAASLGGRTVYVTPDELLARQAYDHGVTLPWSLGVTTGVDAPLVLAILADRLGTTARDMLENARLSRVRVVRSIPSATSDTAAVTAETLSDDDARQGAIAAGAFLARGVDAQGRFRYLIDAPTNRTLPGYDWPRHAGATYFLAQVADLSHDPEIAWATLRAAALLRDTATVDCGESRCIGSEERVDVGATALATVAFVEIARTGLDAGYGLAVPRLTAFLRGQQRADGEFMHEYDRSSRRPLDVQHLYYSGEAALALSRADSLLGDPRDREAAARALAYLVGPAWHFFGSRYYFGEEHWTCQAMEDLWDRAPNPAALAFCLRWQAYGRRLQYAAGDTAFDAEGAYGFGPVLTPRLTPVGSRSEAAIATLRAAFLAGSPGPEIVAIKGQLRRSLAMLLRHQFRPGPQHLMADPAAVSGAIPGSEVDWQLRIDYAQHTGSALIRWLNLPSDLR